MKWSTRRLARRLGLDHNPLRRRSDKIASLVTTGLFAVFLAGAPFVSLAAWHWSDRISVTEQHQQLAWHQVQAVVVRNLSIPDDYYYGGGTWSWARWTAPAGHRQQEVIPVSDGAYIGSHVRIWVNTAGQWSGPPLSRTVALTRGVASAIAGPAGLAAVLVCLGCVVRFGLERRELAAWETAWTWIGPKWTQQFRAHG
jgi:hypothetical protein